MSRASILAALAGVGFAVLATSAATGTPVRIPGDQLPAPVSKLGDLSTLTALAISDDGTTAAGAFAAEKAGRSVLRLSRGAGTGESPADIPLRGRVRSLRFSRDGADLFVVASRDAKRDEVFLLRIDVSTRELSREIVLPRGASDVDAIDAGTLIVVSPNELRTFFVPSLTSGPLYRLDGSNLAVAAVPGTRRLLVAGDDSILLVDLDDPQTRDGLSARERLMVATPVVALAVAPDGRQALARHDDGTVERFTVEPLGGAVADGNAVAIAWPGARAGAPPPAARSLALPDVPTEVVPSPPADARASRTEPPAIASPPPAEPPSSQQGSVPSSPSAPPPTLPEPTPLPPAEPPPQSPPPPQPSDTPPPPAQGTASQPDASAADRGVLRGSVTGAAASSIVAVVILGPDNVLHEAARAKPTADGSWSVTGLAPGTYRIQLDAGSGGAVEANPAFRTVRIGPTGPTQVAPIEARRVSSTR